MRSYLIKVNDTPDAREIDIDHSLDSWYEELTCTCIDIARATLGEEEYMVVLDDEGLLKMNPIASACDKTGRVMYVGNLLLFREKDGETRPLRKKDITNIEKHMRLYVDSEGTIRPVLQTDDTYYDISEWDA